MKVVVTGIGMINALGNDCATIWQNLWAGRSGIKLVNGVPIARANIPPLEHQPRVEQLLLLALTEAIATASLKPPVPNACVIIGTSRGYQREWELVLNQAYPIEQFPYLLSANLGNQVANLIGCQSLAVTISAACASGNWAIAKGYEMIHSGSAKLVVVGAVDSAITPLSMAGFQQLGALAPTGIYPFSQEREGLVLGEGSAVMILESLDHALRRSAPQIYGQIAGFGITNDAFHITSASQNLTSAKGAIADCLTQSNLKNTDIDYINAHGTATVNNDQMEAKLIGELFPNHPLVTSTKSATGHCLGATGLMEAIFCLLALQQQAIPPCVNLLTPAFDLHIPTQALSYSLNHALNFSFGFGGQNTVIALSMHHD